MSRVLAILLLATLQPSGLLAQQASGGAQVQGYAMTRSDDLRVRSIALLSVPFSGQTSLVPGVDLGVSGAYANSFVRLDNGAQEQVGGLIDTRLWLQFGNDRFRAVASALLPTGDVVHDLGDALVVGLLSTDLLPFAVSQWGTGGGVTGDVSYAFIGSNTAFTLTAGGTRLVESNPLESVRSYVPAWHLRGRAALEVAMGPAEILSVLVGYQQFGTDTYGTEALFQPGERLEGAVSYAIALGPRTSAMAYASAYHGGGGTSQLEILAPGDLGPGFSGVATQASRTLLRLGGEMRLDRGSYDVMPRAHVRVLRRGDGVGQGWLATIGAGGGFRLWSGSGGWRVRGEPTAAIRVGRLVAAQDVASAIVGWEVGLTLRWGRAR